MANNTLAYGFVQYAHLADERVEDVGVPLVMDMVEQSVAEYNRMINALMATFVEPTTEYKERIYSVTGGTLQPLDESGNPLPVRPSGYTDVAYPIQGGGTAWATNRVSRAMMTVMEANRNTLMAFRQDADWMRRHIMASVFDNATWTYEDEEHGNLTIQPLAITSDSVTYPKRGGEAATDQHYLAQAAAIDDDNNPFDDIYDELMEHPTNEGPVVSFVPTNLKDSVRALTGFVQVTDPDIDYGGSVSTIRGNPEAFGPIRGFGDEVLGKVDKCWIVEWKSLPDSYILSHAVGGGPVVKMRQYPAAALQGFFTENHSPDGNLQEMRMIRYGGFGVANRIAAVITRIGNGAYAIPTGYAAPLAV